MALALAAVAGAGALPLAQTFGSWLDPYRGTAQRLMAAAQGPRDAKGRSLRELDLRTRLFKYPCSFLIYGAAFNALPSTARQAVYGRVWEVLSGRDTRKITQQLSAADRQAILQILRDTKPDLPESFK